MIELKELKPQSATQEEFETYYDFIKVINAEEMPEDPPFTLEYVIKSQKARSESETAILQTWYVQKDEAIVARLLTAIEKSETNQHILFTTLHTHPEYRNQGYARLLLQKVLDIADQYKRTLVMDGTSTRIPAGETFAEHLGATRGLEGHINQLKLNEIAPDLLKCWLALAESNPTYSLGCWMNDYPESELEQIAQMMQNTINSQPRENLQLEDDIITPARLKDMLKGIKTRGTEFWTLYLRHQSGELAGFTEIYLNPINECVVWQGGTGVMTQHRGQGLGKWLKAAMVQKLQQEKPVVTSIRTGNANSNEAMLAINHTLGFKPYFAITQWQVEVEKIKNYLQKNTRVVSSI